MTNEELTRLIESEGDYKEWIHTCKNGLEFKCIIRRGELKFLCGYVYIPENNELYGSDGDNIDCHGGITYHRQEEDFWVLGFDCDHYNDYIPKRVYSPYEVKLHSISYDSTSNYRTMEYVTEQCEYMAEQISEKSLSAIRNAILNRILK